MAEHWEVIYETGAHSVVYPENVEDAKAALAEQHRRAEAGEVGGPTGHPAERVKRVLVYDDHPGDVTQDVHKDEALSRFKELVKDNADANGVVNLQQLAANLEARPRVASGPHESNYAAQETEELDLAFLNGEGE